MSFDYIGSYQHIQTSIQISQKTRIFNTKRSHQKQYAKIVTKMPLREFHSRPNVKFLNDSLFSQDDHNFPHLSTTTNEQKTKMIKVPYYMYSWINFNQKIAEYEFVVNITSEFRIIQKNWTLLLNCIISYRSGRYNWLEAINLT